MIQRVLGIPPKRTDRALVTYLNEEEMHDALLAAPDRATRIGRRDHALLLLALETGLRVSELTALTCGTVHLDTGAHVRCHGKGRKERITPLRRQTRALLHTWLTERAGAPTAPLFPGPTGQPLSRDAVRRLVERHVATAAVTCPSLSGKTVSPHTLRHKLRHDPSPPRRRRRDHRPLARTLFWGSDPVLMCSVTRGEIRWLSVLLPIVRCAPM